MRFFKFFLLALLLIPGMRCSETEGTKGSTNPSLDDPYVIDMVLCIEVLNNKPVGITTIFTDADEIHLWVEWDNIFDTHNLLIEWINPDGDLEFNDEINFSSDNGRKVTWFSIKPGTPVKKGVWEVAVFLDGVFERSLFLEII